jgi:hypothetical protein
MQKFDAKLGQIGRERERERERERDPGTINCVDEKK